MANRWRSATPCAFALTQACQAAVGEFTELREWPDLNRVETRLYAVPIPRTYGDALEASLVLHRFIQRAGVEMHHRLHGSNDDWRRCDFIPARYERLTDVDPAHPEQWRAAALFRAWASAYIIAFRAHHPGALSDRAIERLRSGTPSGVRIAALAKALGCSVPVLRRQFSRDKGEPVRRFAIRFRACNAFDLLRTTDWKVEAIARAAGWKSRKNLNLTLWRLAQTTPAQIRTLDESSAATMRNRLAGHAASSSPLPNDLACSRIEATMQSPPLPYRDQDRIAGAAISVRTPSR